MKKKAKNKIAKKPAKKSVSRNTSKNSAGKFGVTPLGDRVLVRPFEAEELTKTASGIIIPDTVSKEKPEQGEVVAIGAKVESQLQVGDKVVFSKYGYDEIKYAGKEYYILKEDQILAVITK